MRDTEVAKRHWHVGSQLASEAMAEAVSATREPLGVKPWKGAQPLTSLANRLTNAWSVLQSATTSSTAT